MVRVAVLDDYQKVAATLADWSALSGAAELSFFHDHLADPDALVERLRPFGIVCVMRERTPFPAAVLERLPALKLLVSTGPRNAAIDVAAAHRLGITVCGTRGGGAAPPELAWGLILALVRNIPAEDRAMRQGGWQTTIGHTLEGKTLGILGLGRIGTRMAAVGRAFGMEIVAWSRNLTPEAAVERGARYVGKDELFRCADILTVHLVSSDRTRGLVGAGELGLMKATGYLVNTSRGPIVDEAALVAALTDRRIAGAALDVYDVEPLPSDHPLRRLDNTVLSPHIGYVTEEGYRIFYRDTVEDIRAWLAGKPIRVVDPAP